MAIVVTNDDDDDNDCDDFDCAVLRPSTITISESDDGFTIEKQYIDCIDMNNNDNKNNNKK